MLLKKGFLKPVVCLLVFAGLAASASAQVTISGGFALSNMEAKVSDLPQAYDVKGDIGLGGNVYVDYLLPIGIPLSLGVEAGYDTSSFTGTLGSDDVAAIPLLARIAYHFDLMSNLDLYLVGKAGYVFGTWDGPARTWYKSGATIEDPAGFGFGFDLGAAFYFTSNFGIFVEGGFDRYNIETTISSQGQSYKVEVPFSRFATFGISVKF